MCVFAHAQPLPPAPEASRQVKFTPPKIADIPNSPLGDMVSYGRDIFVDTQRYAAQDRKSVV